MKKFAFWPQKKEEALRCLKEHLDLLAPSSSSFSEPPEKKEKGNISALDELYDLEEGAESESPMTEVEQYLLIAPTAEAKDIAVFWKRKKDLFPRLYKLARSILAVPATSASSEREFSAAGFLLNEKRSRLKSETVESLLLIRSLEIGK